MVYICEKSVTYSMWSTCIFLTYYGIDFMISFELFLFVLCWALSWLFATESTAARTKSAFLLSLKSGWHHMILDLMFSYTSFQSFLIEFKWLLVSQVVVYLFIRLDNVSTFRTCQVHMSMKSFPVAGNQALSLGESSQFESNEVKS